MKKCGLNSKNDDTSDMLVYTSHDAINQMANLLRDSSADEKALAEEFKKLISRSVQFPDMALSGRMLETGEITDTTVEASLQAAHAISTHDAHPEIDYYIAADDIKGEDHGAGFVDEAIFSSACFYKYFSIHWEGLVENLGGNEALAAHTVGAFLRAAATVTPSGKQNSFAAHNPPDGILVEIRKEGTPISYANAFANPVKREQDRDLIGQSIAQLARQVRDLDIGFGRKDSDRWFWFSANLRYPLNVVEKIDDKDQEILLTESNIPSLEKLIESAVKELGYDWASVQTEIVNAGVK